MLLMMFKKNISSAIKLTIEETRKFQWFTFYLLSLATAFLEALASLFFLHPQPNQSTHYYN